MPIPFSERPAIFPQEKRKPRIGCIGLAPSRPHLVVLTGRTLAPYDEQLLPDAMRLDFCVPDVAQQKQNVDMFNAAKRPTSTMLALGCKR
jgi:hypothetical protein